MFPATALKLKIATHLHCNAIVLKKPQCADSCWVDCFQDQHSTSEDKNQKGIFPPPFPSSKSKKKHTAAVYDGKELQSKRASWLNLITNKQVNDQLNFASKCAGGGDFLFLKKKQDSTTERIKTYAENIIPTRGYNIS